MGKSLATILLLLAVYLPLQAQFGVSARYAMHSYESMFSEGETWLDNNVEIGANYWFRLKNKRIEFLPEVYYGLSDEMDLRWPTGNESTTKSYFGFEFTTNIYLFDLKDDCNCPTFSKQGPTFQKSIFVSVSPGVQLKSITATPEGSTNGLAGSTADPYIGIGLGFDIGLSDLLTISPLVQYRLHFTDELIPSTVLAENIEESISALAIGLRLTFRPDYVKQNRY